MAKINLDKMSRQDLLQLHKDVGKALEEREKTARRDALAAVQEAAKTHGFSLNDLVGAGQKVASKATNPPKYRHPENPDLAWTGKGRQPGWIKVGLAEGKSLEDYAI